MRTSLAISGLAALAVAAPAPQSFDFDAILTQIVSTEVPTGTAAPTATYDSASAVASAAAVATEDPLALSKRSIKRRDALSNPEPVLQSEDTAEAFLARTDFTDKSSAANFVAGYTNKFTSKKGATTGSGYLIYEILDKNYDPSTAHQNKDGFRGYDVNYCANKCTNNPTCMGFNIYVERTPTTTPTNDNKNPASVAIVKCVLWGMPVDVSAATNDGQFSGSPNSDWFHTVITASNGFSKNNFVPKSVDGFTGPGTQLKGAIEAKGYIGMRLFDVYDPALCAKTCTETTAFDKQHIQRTIVGDGDHYAYDACNFFNVYVLSDVNRPTGMICSMYQDVHGAGEDTNIGQWRGADFWSPNTSYGYSLTVQDPGKALKK
ncbi:hypothetical protein B0J12DRAFT_596814 [Macrophomina phaseolina]|uniref:Uncharacterized protein n=1 Tax=Macrophomina phaseolina TaxID=35725 RepID=A0ABQ8GI78_9PEZI|nr:hypothetical protein B0J12DRAFT_596814 [Macrophomina phaseolina]